ncbi:MAG TPA: CHASE2 domain-containing protein [Pyrinomonadaceae bacterium]|jgi:hypothetical protein
MNYRRLLNLAGYMLLGYAVTLLLIGVKYAIEHTGWGEEAQKVAYRALLGQLSEIDRDGPPVVVADISQIPGGRVGEPTPRADLMKILKALVDKSPRAIALDIDFSPGATGLREGDKELFDYCLKVTREQHVPVFLGVYNAQAEDRDTWLGLPEYAEMAVSLDILPDTSRLPVSVQAEGVDTPLPSLGAALARVYREEVAVEGPPDWIRGAVETDEMNLPATQRYKPPGLVFTYELVPANYSKLDQIKAASREIKTEQSVIESGNRFKNKLVILGDGTTGSDQYVVEGRPMPVLGAFLHASTAYTLAREPLYEFTESARLWLDFAVSSVVIFLVVLVRVFNPDEEKDDAWHSRRRKYVAGVVILTLIGGILLVRGLKVMWFDFLPVAIALVLHGSVEDRVHGPLSALWRRATGARAGGDAGGGGEGEGGGGGGEGTESVPAAEAGHAPDAALKSEV